MPVEVNRRSAVKRVLAPLASLIAATPVFVPGARARPADRWTGIGGAIRWLPFRLVTGDTLVVQAQLAGVSVNAILDSGSAASIIGSSLAARLGLHGQEQRTVRGNSGRASVKIVRDVDVMLGRVARRLPFALIADLSAVSSAFGGQLDLILGQDILAGQSIALDFAASRYAFIEQFAGGGDWASAPLAHGANRELVISGSVAGLPPVPLIVDLGSATPLMLSRHYADDHHLLNGRPQSTAALGGVEGVRIATAFMIGSTSIAGLAVKAIPSLAVDEWLSTSAVGNIGLPLIAQFDVVLDLAADRLWLRRPVHRPIEMLKDRSGLGLSVSRAALTVIHVAAGSPAAKAGLTVGERITEVNGRPVDTAYTRDRLWHWRYDRAGTIVKLGVEGAGIRELRLADYY